MGLVFLQTGLGERSPQPGRLPENWLHIGHQPQTRERRRSADRGAAAHGFTSARTSTIGGHSMRTRSSSTTWAAPCTLTFAGGKRWNSPGWTVEFVAGRRARPWSPSCARTSRRTTMWPALMRSVGPTIVMTALARRTAADLAVGGTVCQRAGRRSRIGRPDADLVRHGTAFAAARTQRFPGHRLVEGPQPRDPRDSARGRRTRRGSHPLHEPRDPAQRRRPVAGGRWHRLLRRGDPPGPRGQKGVQFPALTLCPATSAPTGGRGTYDPHRLGRGRGRDAGPCPRARRSAPSRGSPGRAVASNIRTLRTIPATRPGDQLHEPRSPGSRRRGRKAELRHGTARSQRGPARRTPARRPGPARTAGHARRNAEPGNQPVMRRRYAVDAETGSPSRPPAPLLARRTRRCHVLEPAFSIRPVGRSSHSAAARPAARDAPGLHPEPSRGCPSHHLPGPGCTQSAATATPTWSITPGGDSNR